MKRVYIDTDIILDVFLERDKFYTAAAELLSLADTGKISAVTTPLVFSNLFYILTKYKSKSVAKKSLATLEAIVKVIPVNDKAVTSALNSKFADFEDALQYFAARDAKVNYLITRNKKDFEHSEISVLSAHEFVKLFSIAK